MDGSVVQWNEELKPARGFMFDVDGTLILSNRSLGGYTVLPGATEVLGTLKARGIPYVLLTNGSNYAPPEQAAKLRGLGLPVEDAQMLTPSSVAADLMQRHGIKRCLVLGTPGVGYALSEAGIEIAFTGEENAAKADAVYIGWHPECGMKDIETAANAIWNGAKLYVASDVPFFASAGGRAMGYSFAITAAVQAADQGADDPDRQAVITRAQVRRAQARRETARGLRRRRRPGGRDHHGATRRGQRDRCHDGVHQGRRLGGTAG